MKYICLVYHEEGKLEALAQSELEALVSDCIAWTEELEKQGHHIFSAGLQSVRQAATVRRRNGRLSMTDGPFAETKEQLGGFTLLDARDLNEAIRLAGMLPAARLGSVEIRPLLEPDGDTSREPRTRCAGTPPAPLLRGSPPPSRAPGAGSFDQKVGAAIRQSLGN